MLLDADIREEFFERERDFEELPEPSTIREVIAELIETKADESVEFVAGQTGLPESRVRELGDQFDLGRRVDRTHRLVSTDDFVGFDRDA